MGAEYGAVPFQSEGDCRPCRACPTGSGNSGGRGDVDYGGLETMRRYWLFLALAVIVYSVVLFILALPVPQPDGSFIP